MLIDHLNKTKIGKYFRQKTILIFLMTVAVVGLLESPSRSTSKVNALKMREQQNNAPGVIDGAVSPQLIPDKVAYSLLFLSVAELANASPGQIARARAKIVKAHLDEADINAFLFTANEYVEKVKALSAQAAEIHRRNPSLNSNNPEWQRLLQLDKQKDQHLTSSIALLATRLSPLGMRKLQDYLQDAKRRMKMVPEK